MPTLPSATWAGVIIIQAPDFDTASDFTGAQAAAQFTSDFRDPSADGSPATVTTFGAIAQPAVTAEIALAVCFGSSTGSIALSVSGGTAPYSYLWAGGSTANPRSALPEGAYTVTVTDSTVPDPANFIETGVVTASFDVGQNPRIEVVVQQQGGDVTLLTTGGTAPYTYLWSDGNTTPYRTQLPPGTYTVVIRDALGCGAQLSVTVDPYRFFFSQNPVLLDVDGGDAYRADPSTKPNLVFECQVLTERGYQSGIFAQTGPTLQQPPGPYGHTTFDVQALVEGLVEPFLPADVASGAVVRADAAFRRFYLRHREVTAYGPSAYTELEQNYVVRGGLSFQEYAAGTFFNGYQKGVRPFFTWEPITKKVLEDQPEYLFFMPDSFTLTEFRCVVRATYADGSVDVLPFATVTGCHRYELYCLPVGYRQRWRELRVGARGRQLVQWEIYVTNAAGTRLTQIRTYVLDRRYFEFRRYFLYANSLGGLNTLAVVGATERKAAVKSQLSDTARPPRYDPRGGDQTVARKTTTPALSCWSGARSAEQLIADQDFLQSEHVWLIEEGRLLAGVVKDATTSVAADDETCPALRFDFEFVRENRYTPRLVAPPAAVLLDDIAPPLSSE